MSPPAPEARSRATSYVPGGSYIQGPGTVPERLLMNARLIQQRQQQVGHRRVIGEPEVTVAFERARPSAQHQVGQREVVMCVAVAHVAAVQQNGVIEQRPVPVLRGLQLFQEPREQRQMVMLDLYQLLDLIGLVLVMRC